MHWWEHSRRTNVTWVGIPVLTQWVEFVVVSHLQALQGFFARFSSFPHPQKPTFLNLNEFNNYGNCEWRATPVHGIPSTDDSDFRRFPLHLWKHTLVGYSHQFFGGNSHLDNHTRKKYWSVIREAQAPSCCFVIVPRQGAWRDGITVGRLRISLEFCWEELDRTPENVKLVTPVCITLNIPSHLGYWLINKNLKGFDMYMSWSLFVSNLAKAPLFSQFPQQCFLVYGGF